MEALTTIHAALEQLAESPSLGAVPRGPFARRVYVFGVVIDGVTRYLKVAYRIAAKEHAVDILSFSNVSF